ncbi:MAG: erythromycin esterase family protein [Hyphomicrobiales bacterium]
MKNLIYILLLLLPVISFSQNVPTPIKSIDSKNTDFTDLQFLKEHLKGKTIVGLGEQSHLDGTSFIAKIRLVKFLHEEMGFNVIAFESGLYDCTNANNSIDTATDLHPYLFESIFGVWRNKEMKELSDYLHKCRETNNPLYLTGFDHQFVGKWARLNLYKDLTEYIQDVNEQTNTTIEYHPKKLEKALIKLAIYSNHDKKLRKKDTCILYHITNQLLRNTKNINSPKANYWRRVLNSIQTDYRIDYYFKGYPFIERIYRSGMIRDSIMYDNLDYIIKDQYKDQKIILWAANLHLRKNVALMESDKNGSIVKDKNLGVYIRDNYKDKYYFLGITSYKGLLYKYGPLKIKADIGDKIGLEEHFHKFKHPYAFINMKDVKERDLQHFYNSKVFGHASKKCDLYKELDGILYIHELHPSTKIDWKKK